MTNLRKSFMGKKIIVLFALTLMLAGCTPATDTKTTAGTGTTVAAEQNLAKLPAPLVDEKAEVPYASTNSSITVENLDQYMNRSDVHYIDIRDYEDYATKHFKNFEIIPYFGYVFNAEANTNPEMIQLFGGTPEEPVAVYEESEAVLNALFPKDKNLFIMCEKGGRVTQLMQILDAHGYDISKVYNIGGIGQYTDAKYKEMITDAYELTLEASYGFEGLTRK